MGFSFVYEDLQIEQSKKKNRFWAERYEQYDHTVLASFVN